MPYGINCQPLCVARDRLKLDRANYRKADTVITELQRTRTTQRPGSRLVFNTAVTSFSRTGFKTPRRSCSWRLLSAFHLAKLYCKVNRAFYSQAISPSSHRNSFEAFFEPHTMHYGRFHTSMRIACLPFFVTLTAFILRLLSSSAEQQA